MGLRKYINDLEFSKKVNYSSSGRKFENSDLARIVELNGKRIPHALQQKGWKPKALAVYATLISPITCLSIYGIAKIEKWNKSPSYNNFRDDSDLILNH